VAVEYVIDSRHRLVRSTFSGEVKAAELFDLQRRLKADPAFDPTFSQLGDVRLATSTDEKDGNEVARELARNRVFGPTSRHAFVVSETVYTGHIRRLAIYLELAGGTEQIRVFRDMDEALAWLEISE
jgi:hypothetical protein